MKHKRSTRSCKSCHVQQDNTARRQSKRHAHLTTHNISAAEEVADEFCTLEANARSSGMEDVSFHSSERARMAWIRAHASRKKGQQQDIRSFFDT